LICLLLTTKRKRTVNLHLSNQKVNFCEFF